MLALLVLCDGPVSSDSFRPSSDETQWWARRDSLVRIDFAHNFSIKSNINADSLDSVQTIPSFLLFNDSSRGLKEDVNSYGPALVALSQKVDDTSLGYFPSERSLINLLKNSSSRLSNFMQGIDRQGGNRSASFERSAANVKTNSLRSDISKKELIQSIQSTWPFEVLRQHSMAGSVDLIAKKRNLADLHQVWQTLSSDNQQSIKTSNNPLTALFERAFVQLKSGTAGTERKVTILLLHEDYPHELQIFGLSTDSAALSHLSSDPKHIILCIMGAVRDMTEDEVTSLFSAAKTHHIATVTANLGRTAEFTSKIVMALHAHNTSGRLLYAVETLHRLQHVDNEQQVSTAKLTSIRPDQSTWDGHRSSKRQRPSSPPIIVEERSRDVIVVVAKVSLRPEDITSDLQHRPRLLGLIQLVVYTLWKSRMVSDTAQGMTGPFQSILYLLFADGRMARIDQAAIVQEVEDNHCPAPSEHQVLSMLIRLLQKPGILYPTREQRGAINSTYDKKRLTDIINEVRNRNDTAEDSFAKQQEVYILQPLDTEPLLCTDQQPRRDKSILSITTSLSHFAYDQACHCSNLEALEEVTKMKDQALVMLLGFEDTTETFQELSKIIAGSSKSKKITKARRKCLSTVVLSSSHVSTPAMVITTLQHWAYHGRLFPALKSMSKQGIDNTKIE